MDVRNVVGVCQKDKRKARRRRSDKRRIHCAIDHHSVTGAVPELEYLTGDICT